MSKGRLEAFSDGVFAIIITIMVLELVPPHGSSLKDLIGLAPIAVSYVLSFVNVGIYWNNHHHVLQAARVVDGRVLWANLHLLFWLSLFPFATAWMGENEFASLPVALYGVLAFAAGSAFTLLVRSLVRIQPPGTPLLEAPGTGFKGVASMAGYLAGIPLAFVQPWLSLAIYIGVAVMWFIPERRLERALLR